MSLFLFTEIVSKLLLLKSRFFKFMYYMIEFTIILNIFILIIQLI